ncbi:hypothetical protein XccvBFoX4_gp42c [Xanthomonas phage FoX4]|uniref:Uncharacterized protein n=1 Tax=Xanthomonas phage FoX4 TaxID=2723900 RepID=A0A858XBG9_9CAUD|nr:hypothetical protein KNU97_gp42 [Xanthomonas phage FoX4]QJI52996.1 hypothetical protein XccvBFoX4_gp42c [Xanthomonas phage FoX4]
MVASMRMRPEMLAKKRGAAMWSILWVDGWFDADHSRGGGQGEANGQGDGVRVFGCILGEHAVLAKEDGLVRFPVPGGFGDGRVVEDVDTLALRRGAGGDANDVVRDQRAIVGVHDLRLSSAAYGAMAAQGLPCDLLDQRAAWRTRWAFLARDTLPQIAHQHDLLAGVPAVARLLVAHEEDDRELATAAELYGDLAHAGVAETAARTRRRRVGVEETLPLGSLKRKSQVYSLPMTRSCVIEDGISAMKTGVFSTNTGCRSYTSTLAESRSCALISHRLKSSLPAMSVPQSSVILTRPFNGTLSPCFTVIGVFILDS